MRLFILCIAALLLTSAPAYAEEQQGGESVIQYFPRSDSGEKAESDMPPEAVATLNQVIVNQIKEFCSDPKNRTRGKCGNIADVMRGNPSLIMAPGQ